MTHDNDLRAVAAIRRRGWAIVAVFGVTETTSFGLLYYAFGAFLPTIERDLGWSKSTITGAFSVALLVSAVSGLFVGHYLDRHSPRLVMTAGGAVGALAVFGWSHVTAPWHLYAVWVLAGLSMGSVLYEPAFVVISQWFGGEARRRALTIVTLVAGLSSTIFLPLCAWLIRTHEWRPALRILALVMLVVVVPSHWVVLRRAPATPIVASPTPLKSTRRVNHIETHEPRSFTVAEALRDHRFWFMFASALLLSLVISATTAHQIALLEERGWTAQRAAAAMGAIGLWQVGGRLVFGPMGRWFSSRSITVMVFFCQVLALVCIGYSVSGLAVAGYVAMSGLARGMYTLIRATLVADLFGIGSYGAISSRMALGSSIMQAFGPLLVSELHDRSGDYDVAIVVMLVFSVLAALFASLIQAPRYERRHLAPEYSDT